jgi:SAM-dependent methyltransferase
MPETVTRCPLCSGSRNIPFDSRNFLGVQVENCICRNCGLVYQSPRMTVVEMGAYYQAEYRRTYQGAEGPVTRDLAVQAARAKSLFGFIKPHVASMERCLDIGCSAGLILQHFQEHYGSQAVGIEPGDAYRAYTRDLGITVYSSLEELEKAGEKCFNMVSMSHVLEHLPNPVDYLTHLREKLLVPEGWLLIEVPNLYAHESFEIAHLLSFSPHTLRELLQRSGFTLVKIEKHGRPNSQILPLYLSVLCRPELHRDVYTIRPERGVKYKRRAGMIWRKVVTKLFPKRAWLLQG